MYKTKIKKERLFVIWLFTIKKKDKRNRSKEKKLGFSHQK
jgi:hypothetical protein